MSIGVGVVGGTSIGVGAAPVAFTAASAVIGASGFALGLEVGGFVGSDFGGSFVEADSASALITTLASGVRVSTV